MSDPATSIQPVTINKKPLSVRIKLKLLEANKHSFVLFVLFFAFLPLYVMINISF